MKSSSGLVIWNSMLSVRSFSSFSLTDASGAALITGDRM